MKKFKQLSITSMALMLLFILSGCVKTHSDGTPVETGFMYRFLVQPLGNFITFLVDKFDWNYGWAIIVVTIIIRIIILPLGISQAKKTMIQAEKMQTLKPQLTIAQERLKKATTREEQMKAQADMQRVYRENEVSMLGGIGCLPLLIQMPIFSALYFTTRYTPGIQDATFYGVHLGNSSLVLVAIAGVAYMIQGYISLIGIPEDQKKTMKTMVFVSPIMIVLMSISAPAGVTLYWVVGGIFSCLQTFITNVLMKPKIRKQVAEEFKKNPPKTVVTEERKDVTPVTDENVQIIEQPKKNRNVGKQNK